MGMEEQNQEVVREPILDLYFFRSLRRWSGHGRKRQFDGDLQSIAHILRVNTSAVELYGALRDGEAQTHAAARALPSFTHPIERFEDVSQFRLGNARTMIAYSEHGGIEPPAQSNFDRRARRRIANPVADYV